MVPFNSHRQVLMHRLEEQGMDKSIMPGFIWSVKSCISKTPHMDHRQLNKRLKILGWYDTQVDHRTMQLITTCLNAEAEM